jgi:hypothetical protein
MSYELCVIDTQLAATREAAYNVWNDTGYLDISQPASDRTARKWRTREALTAFNPQLEWAEPKEPGTGVFATLMKKKPEDEHRALTASLPVGEESTTFWIFDQAVEIELPWSAEPDQLESIVRDVWRHLEKLSQLGLGAIYDTERNVMLNLDADFDAVVQRYRENLKDDDDEDETGAPVATPHAGIGEHAARGDGLPHAPAADTQPPDGQPFTGNVGTGRPW